MLRISDQIGIPDEEIEMHAVRAQGAGGQNVNKVSTAIHLRFDIAASSLPETVKERLLALTDQRVTSDGVVVIKAQNHRSRPRNEEDARERLAKLVAEALQVPRRRIPTRPGRAAKERRVDQKKRKGALKRLRGSPEDH